MGPAESGLVGGHFCRDLLCILVLFPYRAMESDELPDHDAFRILFLRLERFSYRDIVLGHPARDVIFDVLNAVSR